MKRIIIDCDPGIDDALAIMLAFASESIEVDSITTVGGNVTLAQTTANTLRLIDYFGWDIPVYSGLDNSYSRNTKPSVHGKEGFGDASLPYSKRIAQDTAVDFMLRRVASGQIQKIVAIGPLTNISAAFRTNQQVMNTLDELVIMGGAVYESGNVTDHAEFNFYADPESADYVLQQPIRKVVVPLDVTRRTLLTDEYMTQLSSCRISDFINDLTRPYREAYRLRGFSGCGLHDPLAMGYAIDPTFLTTKPFSLRVIHDGERVGTSVIKRSEDFHFPTYVAVDVDAPRFLQYFVSRVGNL